jgi:ribose/xylose/arabinose/galactoside ABC-type transport system permease subunit
MTATPRKLGFRIPSSREWGLLGLSLLAIVVFSIAFPDSFPTLANAAAILRNLALDAVMVAGMVVLLVSGVFDLSIGSMFSMIGVLTCYFVKQGMPVPLAVAAGLAIAAAGGALNGFIVARVKVNALIATLGTMQIYRGIAVLVGGPGISFLPESYSRLGQAEFLGLPAPVWVMIVVIVLFEFLTSRTRFFRQYYYIGANPKAARLSGIRVEPLQIAAFTIMGVLAGLAGILFSARLATGVSVAGEGAELRIITAAILGGASLTGGRGTIWGGLIGVVFVALIGNALILGQVSSYWQSIVTGAVLVLAVAADHFLNRKRRGASE